MNNNISTSSTQQELEEEKEEEEEEEEEEEAARCDWDFDLSMTISPQTLQVSDVIGAIELDPSNRVLATGGISRKIRIYTLSPSPSLEFYICAPAKLSSLSFKPNSNSKMIGSGDYDGVVTEYDLEKKTAVSERDEHGGRRVWSVDYSRYGDLATSASDDGTAHVWDTRCGDSVGVMSHNAPVCSSEFEKTDGFCIGLGCADRRASIYDMRRLSSGPVNVFSGHSKTVTYVKFVKGGSMMVTSSVDGCHRMWDLRNNSGGGDDVVRIYRGHRNVRSFVGMDVNESGGLIGCGSESNEVFVYDLRWGEPIWVKEFENHEEELFVSAVCWREVSEDECALVAGGSNGVVKLFVGRRK